MGKKCSIIRGRNNSIEVVEAPNGESSILFDNLVKYTNNKEKALDLWTIPYTEGFTELYGDWQKESTSLSLDKNGEPSVKNVLNYSKFIRNNGKKLTNKQLADLSNNLYSLEINDLEGLYKELRATFYKKGIFSIEKDSLTESNLYNKLEVMNILSNPSIQNNIKDLVERIEIEYLSDNSTNINNLISTHYFNDDILLFDTNQTIGIGKFKALNPSIVDKTVASKLAGVTNRNIFNKLVNEIPYDSIIERYKNDSNFADNFYNKYSTLKVVPTMVETSQEVVLKQNPDNLSLLKEVLLTDIDNKDLQDNLDLLERVDDTIWENNPNPVKEVLKEIEKNLIPFNIDIVGLNELYDTKSRQEIMEFLIEVENFTNLINDSFTSVDNLERFSNLKDSFFDVVSSRQVDYLKVSINNQDRVLVNIKPISSELELFNKSSLIKTGEDLYHKVNVMDSLESVYDVLYDVMINDTNILPKEAYYPTAFNSDNNLNLGKLKDIKNRDLILSDIKRYVQKQMNFTKEVVNSTDMESLEKLTLYKILFKHPINSTDSINKEVTFNNVLNFNGNRGYLTGNFVNDFYQELLTNKADNSNLYREVFTNFNIDETGIYLNNNDVQTKQELKLLIPNNKLFNDLKQYALISKNKNLLDLFEYQQNASENFIKKDLDVIFYSNNPEQLPLYKGNFTKDNGLLILQNGIKDFIRVKEGVYEKFEQKGNLTFYKVVPLNTDVNYFNYDVKSTKDININLDKYLKNINTDNSNFVEMDNLYTKNELLIINKEIDECG